METILVADDEPAILEFLTTHLEDERYRLLPVVDGQAALEALGSHNVDLAIADAMMPGLGAWD